MARRFLKKVQAPYFRKVPNRKITLVAILDFETRLN
jgi:hypothetical protein